MSNSNDIQGLLAALMSEFGLEPIDIKTVEFSEEGRAFVAYNGEGDAWGGDLTDDSLSVEEVKTRLLKDIESGSLAQHFAAYQPVPKEQLEMLRNRNTDWATIYTA